MLFRSGATDLKPGSASKPFFGVQPAIVDEQGNELEGECSGNLIIKAPWPGMIRTQIGRAECRERWVIPWVDGRIRKTTRTTKEEAKKICIKNFNKDDKALKNAIKPDYDSHGDKGDYINVFLYDFSKHNIRYDLSIIGEKLEEYKNIMIEGTSKLYELTRDVVDYYLCYQAPSFGGSETFDIKDEKLEITAKASKCSIDIKTSKVIFL